MPAFEKYLCIYRTKDKKEPFTDWLRHLKDQRAKQLIQARLARLRLGNLGYCKSVGNGVFELKLDFGPGYRIYIGQDGSQIVILLCGGDKSSQDADIKKARTYWQDYKRKKDYVNY